MQIQYNTSIMRLEELPLDIGYASEKVFLKTREGKKQSLGGQTGKTQLIITLPKIDDDFKAELEEISKELPKESFSAALVVANHTHQSPEIDGFDFYIDEDEEFADYYGVRLSGQPFDGELTKAVILISKDGAIFYDEFSTNMNSRFNTATLARKILAAQECYTGKGCH